MINRILSFSHIALLLFSVLLSGFTLAAAEPVMTTTQQSAVVWATLDKGDAGQTEVARTVQEVADECGSAIGYSVPDVHRPDTLTHLYLAVGDADAPAARWLEEGHYPSFGRSMEVRVHPIEEFGRVDSARGNYLIFGDPDTRPALIDALAQHGLEEEKGVFMTQLWEFVLDGPVSRVGLVALLVVAAGTAAGVLTSSTAYAVSRLQGRSYWSILAADLKALGRVWALAVPAVAVAALAVLGLYNGWNQVGLFTLVALLFAALFSAAALAVHAVVLAVVHLTPIVPALKGRLPVRSTVAGTYLVRIPALVLVLAVSGSLVATAQHADEQQKAMPAFNETGQTSRLGLNGSLSAREAGEGVDEPLGQWLRSLDAHGEIALAAQGSPYDTAQGPTDEGGFNAVVVNDRYLQEQELHTADGQRVGPAPDEDQVRVFVPPSQSELAEDVRANGPGGWFDIYAQDPDSLQFSVQTLQAGQEVFTYGSLADVASRALVRDPVVVALPSEQVLTESSYVAFMTQDAVVFPDPEVADRAREDPQMAEYISMVQPVQEKAAAEYGETVADLRIEGLNLAAAAIVLLLTSVATCLVVVRIRAQTVFARHISGWRFTAAHRRFLAAETLVLAAFAGWAFLRSRTEAAAAYGNLDPIQAAQNSLAPALAGAIAAGALALTLLTLAVLHRRLIRDGATQA